MKKLLIALILVGVAGAAVTFVVVRRNRSIVTVVTEAVSRQDLVQSVVANGEIRPKQYVNISSNAFGRIVSLPVSEGDRVEAEQFLAQIESVQTEAEVQGAQAGLDAAASELEGMEAAIRSGAASLASAEAEKRRIEADFARSELEFDRAKEMLEEGLISREQFDRQESAYRVGVAQIEAANARIAQADAESARMLTQRDGLTFRMGQQRAALTRARDELSKTTITSPLSGVITYLPVNQGEIAIVGVQNQPGTTLMTIADLSVITAELRVDETDIVNLELGQRTEVRVDALGDRVLGGYVSEIGNTALTEGGGGVVSTTPTTDEAKDFKVVITLDDPPTQLRPGLSCTASIETAMESNVLTIPIQALTIREIDEADVPDFVENPVIVPSRPGEPVKVEQEGVFVINDGTVIFQPVQTGIFGTTDVEIVNGLAEGDEIVTGSYRVLRTLQEDAQVKVEENDESS
jgi:HlyD family secretion protein